MKKLNFRKIKNTIFKNKPIRVMLLLTILFVAMNVSLMIMNVAYIGRADELKIEIQNIQKEIIKLQSTATEIGEVSEGENEQQILAPYEEIVPFITLLEDLFGLIDEEARITIKNEEEQIRANRYADYEVKMNINNKKKILFKALDELHKSKYLTRVIGLNMDYDQSADGEVNELTKTNLIIRLFFE